MICFNLVSFGLAYSCVDAGQTCGQNYDNSVIRFFFDVDNSTDLNAVGGLNVNETLRSTVEDSLTQETGVATSTSLGAIGFLDALKMVLAFVSLLTPFPFLVMLYSLAVPILYTMLISVPIFSMYILAIIELIRGGQF